MALAYYLDVLTSGPQRRKKSQQPSHRLAIYNALKSGDISIKPCDVEQLMDISRVVKKESSSASTVIFGDVKYQLLNPGAYNNVLRAPKDALVKLSFVEADADADNSLEMEIYIYKNVINNLILDHFTPNVMSYIGAFQCPSFWNDVYNKRYRNNFLADINQQLSDINAKFNQQYDFTRANVLLIEKGSGMNFDTWINTEKSLEDWKSVLFQIFYTLSVFNNIGLQHNDIHLGNIWIETDLSPKNTIYFVTENTYFVVPTNNLVKIFDFDLASYKNITNTRIKNYLCKDYGVCNKKNPKFDSFIVLSILYSALPEFLQQGRTEEHDFLRDFIRKFVSENFLEEKWGFQHRMCELVAPGQCDGPIKKVTNSNMKQPQNIILSNEFKSFRKVLPEYDPRYLPPGYKDIYAINPTFINKLTTIKIKNITF